MSRNIAACSLVALALALPTAAQAQVKIGFINTMTGPNGALGEDTLNGLNLAIKEAGGKLGGAETTLVMGDDQQKPDIGIQLARQMTERDRVDLVVGVSFSNVLQAIERPVMENGTFLISPNAGTSDLAGKQCNPNFFEIRDQNDELHEAMGQYATAHGLKDVYLMAPNFAAGKEALTGFKRFYKGTVAAEVLTGLTQLDFAAELAQVRAAKPAALFFFYPGALGVNFLKQFSQAGLGRDIQLLGPSYSFDETILPAAGEAAVGAKVSAIWSVASDNPANKAFVAAYQAAYNRPPSPYAAQGYDTGRLIAAALKETGGTAKNKDAFRAALMKADFASVVGKFKFNANHFPFRDYYAGEIVKDAKGQPTMVLHEPIFTDHQDAYVGECKMTNG